MQLTPDTTNQAIEQRIQEIRKVMNDNLRGCADKNKDAAIQKLKEAFKENEKHSIRIFELESMQEKLTGKKPKPLMERLNECLTPEISEKLSKAIKETLEIEALK